MSRFRTVHYLREIVRTELHVSGCLYISFPLNSEQFWTLTSISVWISLFYIAYCCYTSKEIQCTLYYLILIHAKRVRHYIWIQLVIFSKIHFLFKTWCKSYRWIWTLIQYKTFIKTLISAIKYYRQCWRSNEKAIFVNNFLPTDRLLGIWQNATWCFVTHHTVNQTLALQLPVCFFLSIAGLFQVDFPKEIH
jgi:hypothetical protein